MCGSIAAAMTPGTGSVTGTLIEIASGKPVASADLTVFRDPGRQIVARNRTDARGQFHFAGLPNGAYTLGCAVDNARKTTRFSLSPDHETIDLGTQFIATGGSVELAKMTVSSTRARFYESIDRKVYDVGSNLQSAAGSASSILENIPSVEVDLDGKVSLRGNSNVQILINGRPSAMLSAANRAMFLEQLSADSIERVEVITNPAANYQPDGTAGIINLVMKHSHAPGLSGYGRAFVGSARRANGGLSLNYNPGFYNVFGTVNVRQDDRYRTSQETRRHTDSSTNTPISTNQTSSEHMRPLSRLVELGGDVNLTPLDKLHATTSYDYLSFYRTSTVSNLAQTVGGPVSLDYNRFRTDPEWHKTVELTTREEHTFATPGTELDVGFRYEWHQELENNRYQNVYRTPATPDEFDTTRMHPTDSGTNATVDYTHPFAGGAKFAAGYSGDANTYDTDFRATTFDPASAAWVVDPLQTNHFIYKDWIDAIYATFGRPIGRFGFLAGARVERTLVHTDQLSTGATDRTEYFRLHPTLHLSYQLSDTSQLQLNYSHRVRRPESDDLNPFPEYQDPYNLRAGNPKLMPEETHSLEAGYSYNRDSTSYVATVYYRDTYNAFTTVTRYVDAVTLLTTQENLSSNQSGGLEFGAARPLSQAVDLNFSSNAYYSQIDASNLGFSERRSTIAWMAKLNLDWKPTKRDNVQVDAHYAGKRLTAQGYRLASHYMNLGLRHQFPGTGLSFIVTISDLFNTRRERTVIDTPALYDNLLRRRASRAVYAGFVYSFGRSSKNAKGSDFDFSL